MKKNLKINLISLLILIIGTIFILRRHSSNQQFTNIQGQIFGTIYSITYQSSANLQEEIQAELNRFDYSLSPFKEQSIISKVNRNEEVTLDTLFINVFNRALEISKISDGAFDITVAPLVNTWGFGFKKGDFPDSLVIDSLLQFTGYDKIKLENGKVIKKNLNTILDCSAIAKGYAVDVIANYLTKKGINNYMVNIGGEIYAKGTNPDGKPWTIAINKPIDDETALHNEIELILKIKDKGIATSGNYRNYYIKDGKKYAHTINPKTGYPVQHNILSATVVAPDCMTADAYATVFMVIGLDKSLQLLDTINEEIEVCLIYTDQDGSYKIYKSKGLNGMTD